MILTFHKVAVKNKAAGYRDAAIYHFVTAIQSQIVSCIVIYHGLVLWLIVDCGMVL